ncbi:hypothetical protein ACLKA6_006025 [Drosophila palustris]
MHLRRPKSTEKFLTLADLNPRHRFCSGRLQPFRHARIRFSFRGASPNAAGRGRSCVQIRTEGFWRYDEDDATGLGSPFIVFLGHSWARTRGNLSRFSSVNADALHLGQACDRSKLSFALEFFFVVRYEDRDFVAIYVSILKRRKVKFSEEAIEPFFSEDLDEEQEELEEQRRCRQEKHAKQTEKFDQGSVPRK